MDELEQVAELTCQLQLLLFLVDWDLAGPVHLKLFDFPSSSPNSIGFQAYVLSVEFICSFLPSSLFYKCVLRFPALSARIWRREGLTISQHFIIPKHIWVWEPSSSPEFFPVNQCKPSTSGQGIKTQHIGSMNPKTQYRDWSKCWDQACLMSVSEALECWHRRVGGKSLGSVSVRQMWSFPWWVVIQQNRALRWTSCFSRTPVADMSNVRCLPKA